MQPEFDIKDLVKLKESITLRTGLKIDSRMNEKLIASIQIRMVALNIDQWQLYFQKVVIMGKEGNKELLKLVDLIVNTETYFFRDKGQINLLHHKILPKIIQKRAVSKTIKIWSAGCSSGEEAFTMAILSMLLIPKWKDWKFIIVGTDISKEALDQAKKGIFKLPSFRSINHHHWEAFFHRVNENHWKIRKDVSDLVQFFEMNLVADPFPDIRLQLCDVDLILCRNVFIYFHHEAILSIVNKMVDTLCVGGVLLTGHGELHNIHNPFLKEYLFPETVVYQKKIDASHHQLHQLEPDLTNL